MVGNNPISLNISTLGTQSLLNAHAGGLGLGLMQVGPLHDVGVELGSALPYVAGTLGAVAAVSLAGLYAVKLWNRHRASLPPPGMKDIRPEQMQAFFDRHASDKPEQAEALMGFTPLALQEALEETSRVIASEKEDLEAALKAAQDQSTKDAVNRFLESLTELQNLISLKRNQTTRASEKWLGKPDDLFSTVVTQLDHLRKYRMGMADRFFRETAAERRTEMPDSDLTPEIIAAYNALDKGQRERLFGLAVTVWQSLSSEHKNFFWELHSKQAPRGVALPPDFLTLFARLMPKPAFPLNLQELKKHMPALIARRIEAWSVGPALPDYLKPSSHAMIYLKNRETPISGSVGLSTKFGRTLVALAYESSQFDAASGKQVIERREETVDAQAILTIRDAKHSSHEFQAPWTHPDISLRDAEGHNVPGLVYDLSLHKAHSLGDKHSVLVDYSDPKMIEFLESIKSLRGRIEKVDVSKRDPITLATAFWTSFQNNKWGPSNPEKLEELASKARMHRLLNVVMNSGRVEQAVLIQMVFQYLGIPSRLETGKVKFTPTRGTQEADAEGKVQTMWVRVMVPGRRERILCGLSSEIITEDQPAYAAFVDQTSKSGPQRNPDLSRSEIASMIPPAAESMVPPPAAEEEHHVLDAEILEEEDTPLPAPAPESDFDDNEPTRVFPAPPLTPLKPADTAADSGGVNEQQTVVAINPINFEAMKSGLDRELRERYEFLAEETPANERRTMKLRDKVIASWRDAGQPALEKDEDGAPTIIPERFISETVEKWLDNLSKLETDASKQILAQWKDRGTRAVRKAAQEVQSGATKLPSTPPAGRATPPPLPAEAAETAPIELSARRAVPPPMPKIDPEEAARAEASRREAELLETAEAILVARYPSFSEPSEQAIGRAFAKAAVQRSGGDPNRMMDALESLIREKMPSFEGNPAHDHRLRSLRGADAILAELRERYPIFADEDWAPLAYDALREVFRHWQIQYSPISLEDGEYVIPEETFETGFAVYLSKTSELYPDADLDSLRQAFIDGDEGPRSKRWDASEASIEAEIEADGPPAPAVTDVSSVRERVVVNTEQTVSARVRELYPTLPDAVVGVVTGKALAEEKSATDFDLDHTIHTLMSATIRRLADTVRTGTPMETQLKAIIEHSIAEELKQRYTLFAKPAYAKALSLLAASVYDIWNAHNRTFNGSANAIPLRVPEKFINEAMTARINSLRVNNPKLAGMILGSFSGYRADREKRKNAPSSPPAVQPIPISMETILIELKDRFRETSGTHAGIMRALAKTVYEDWLKEDPDRHLEKSHDGLRGLVPEAVLERGLRTLYARIDGKKELKELRQAMEREDRGPRAKRGTQLVEFDIQEEMARRAG